MTETKESEVIIDEYKGKPVIRIPLVADPNPETSWHWMSFGKNKAAAIVKFYERIKTFAEQ